MELEEACALGAYREVAEIDAHHKVSLVQNIYSRQFFVKKELSLYSRPVYDYVQRHPVRNMPAILELAESHGCLTVIEEYIPGSTLQYLLDNSGPLPEQQVISIALQLCTILQELHSADPAIIHRDIKPSNIILSPDGVVKLLDINAARQFTPDREQDTRMMGTVGFAAPEQYGFQQSSVQTDIYAVGALMNTLLTGELPNRIPVSGKLKPIIGKCLQISPRDRYRHVGELRTALEKLLPEQRQSRPVSGWQRFLPPGIRSLEMPNAAYAFLGYVLVYWLTLNLEMRDKTPREQQINRIMVTIMVTAIILFSGNYLNLHQYLPLTRSRSKWIQFVGIALYNIIIVIAALSIIAVLCG